LQDFEEKKEEVIGHYKKSYDLETAMMRADLTTDEKKMLQRDTSFLFRLDYITSELRESIVSTMINNMRSENENLSQKAAVDLGKILWKEKFGINEPTPKGMIPDQIIMTGEE